MVSLILKTIVMTILLTIGQVSWKLGLSRMGGFYVKELNMAGNLMRYIGSGYIWAGLMAYISATIIFMYLLSKYELSLVMPISSISFVFSMLAGIYFFQETVNIYRWAGVAAIIFGVFLISKS